MHSLFCPSSTHSSCFTVAPFCTVPGVEQNSDTQAEASTDAGRPALPPLEPRVRLTPRLGRPLLRPSSSTQALHTSWLLMYPQRWHLPATGWLCPSLASSRNSSADLMRSQIARGRTNCMFKHNIRLCFHSKSIDTTSIPTKAPEKVARQPVRNTFDSQHEGLTQDRTCSVFSKVSATASQVPERKAM